MSRDLRQELYQLMCFGCEKEKYCHEECEHCDEYYEKLEELEEEQEEKEIEEEVQKKMQPVNELLSAMGFDKDSLADYMEEYNEIEEQIRIVVRNEKGNENLIKELQVNINTEKWLIGHYKTLFEETNETIIDLKSELEQLKQALPIVKEGDKYKCPTCRRIIGKYPYCKYCGQALGGRR